MPSLSRDELRKRITAKPNTLFCGAPAKAIDKVLEKGEIVTLRKDEPVFQVGDAAGWFYVLIDGQVVTQRDGVSVRTLVAGEVGGLTTSLDPPGTKKGDGHADLKRSMTHVAASDTVAILKLPHSVYRDLLSNADFALHAMSYMHMRLRSKTSVIALLSGNPGEKFRPAKEGDMRIAVFDTKPYDRNYLGEAFKKSGEASPRITLKFLDSRLGESTAGLAVGCQAVCIFVNDVCNSKVLLALRSAGIKLVLLRNAGYNNVDTKAAKSMGITVMYVPAYSPNAVAEHAFALLATVNRKTHRAYSRVRDGNFSIAGFEGRDLNGMTAGVLGCGKIGQCFISIARGCGMKVLAWDKFTSAEKITEFGATKVDDLHEMLKQCDVISLHLPLTKETRHIIDDAAIRSLKKGAFVINTSRGAVIDAPALIRALVDGHLGGAGLDVYEEESAYFFEDHSDKPIKDDTLARLVNMPNVLVTSHQAFLTDKALNAISQTTLKNALAYQKASKDGSPIDKLPNVIVAGDAAKAKL